ncbi:hypothetical protein ACEPQ5_06890 [Staphylococcus aureus]|uniref:hypothetical protein n=1 Tax=Staphylococcus aureus TaxID=1280 RepID=UPI003F438C4A
MEALSKNAQFVLKHMYQIYLDRLSEGVSLDKSVDFGTFKELHHTFFIGFTSENLMETLKELSKNQYLYLFCASDKPLIIKLKNNAIAVLEKVYSKNIRSLAKDLNQLRKLLGL